MNNALTEILENYIKHNEIELILDRIKEVIDEKNIDYGEELSLSECETLLNYITNLQKENERLKEKIDILKSNLEVEIDDCEDYKEWYRDYKSRCENGINLIDRTIEIIKQQPTGNDDWILSRLYGFKYVLNGDDKSE